MGVFHIPVNLLECLHIEAFLQIVDYMTIHASEIIAYRIRLETSLPKQVARHLNIFLKDVVNRFALCLFGILLPRQSVRQYRLLIMHELKFQQQAQEAAEKLFKILEVLASK